MTKQSKEIQLLTASCRHHQSYLRKSSISLVSDQHTIRNSTEIIDESNESDNRMSSNSACGIVNQIEDVSFTCVDENFLD